FNISNPSNSSERLAQLMSNPSMTPTAQSSNSPVAPPGVNDSGPAAADVVADVGSTGSPGHELRRTGGEGSGGGSFKGSSLWSALRVQERDDRAAGVCGNGAECDRDATGAVAVHGTQDAASPEAPVSLDSAIKIGSGHISGGAIAAALAPVVAASGSPVRDWQQQLQLPLGSPLPEADDVLLIPAAAPKSSPSSSPQMPGPSVKVGAGVTVCGGGSGGVLVPSSTLAGVMRAFEIPAEAPRFAPPDLPTVLEAEDEPTSCVSLTHGSPTLSPLVGDESPTRPVPNSGAASSGTVDTGGMSRVSENIVVVTAVAAASSSSISLADASLAEVSPPVPAALAKMSPTRQQQLLSSQPLAPQSHGDMAASTRCADGDAHAEMMQRGVAREAPGSQSLSQPQPRLEAEVLECLALRAEERSFTTAVAAAVEDGELESRSAVAIAAVEDVKKVVRDSSEILPADVARDESGGAVDAAILCIESGRPTASTTAAAAATADSCDYAHYEKPTSDVSMRTPVPAPAASTATVAASTTHAQTPTNGTNPPTAVCSAQPTNPYPAGEISCAPYNVQHSVCGTVIGPAVARTAAVGSGNGQRYVSTEAAALPRAPMSPGWHEPSPFVRHTLAEASRQSNVSSETKPTVGRIMTASRRVHPMGMTSAPSAEVWTASQPFLNPPRPLPLPPPVPLTTPFARPSIGMHTVEPLVASPALSSHQQQQPSMFPAVGSSPFLQPALAGHVSEPFTASQLRPNAMTLPPPVAVASPFQRPSMNVRPDEVHGVQSPPPPPTVPNARASPFLRPSLGVHTAELLVEQPPLPLPPASLGAAGMARFSRPPAGGSHDFTTLEALQPGRPVAAAGGSRFTRASLSSTPSGGIVIVGTELPPLPSIGLRANEPVAGGMPFSIDAVPPGFARPNMEVLLASGSSSAAGSMAPAGYSEAVRHMTVSASGMFGYGSAPGGAAAPAVMATLPVAYLPQAETAAAVGNGEFPGFPPPAPPPIGITAALNLDPDLPRFARATAGRHHDPDDYTPDLPGPSFT
ncbi:hypothetical protein Vretimale_13725, partial [Volvox reticuliferus]